MKASILFLISLFCFSLLSFAQAPEPDFQIGFGGTYRDSITNGFPLTDGGVMLAGHSSSGNTGDKDAPLYGEMDVWVIRTDSAGEILWQQTYGGEKDEVLGDAFITQDGNILLGASSLSLPSGNKTAPRIKWVDYWLINIDMDGNILWQHTYGGDENDRLTSMLQTSDNGFLLGGDSNSDIYGTKTEASRGDKDYWIVKVDSMGGVEWDKTLGGGGEERLTCLLELESGNFLIGGYSYSPASGDKSETSTMFNSDWWIIMLNPSGEILWENSIGGSSYEYLYDMVEKDEGTIVLTGSSRSEISGDKTESVIGEHDGWIVEINSEGDVLQDVVIGAGGDDFIKSILLDDTVNVLIFQSNSLPEYDKTSEYFGGYDAWVVYVNNDYEILLDYTVGGSLTEIPMGITVNADRWGISCTSYSGISGNKTIDNQGLEDYWYFEIPTCTAYSLVYYDGDNDGFGGSDSLILPLCDLLDGYIYIGGDCDDGDDEIHPLATDICNGIDDNCNGAIDEDVTFINVYLDEDGDGFGNVDSMLYSCFIPDGYCANSWDCNDSDPMIHSLVPYWEDLDSDGYGAYGSSTLFCSLTTPDGYSSNNDDCDDTNADVVFQELYYLDNDNDGYGLPGTAVYLCPDPGIGYSQNADDCDDTNSEIYPGALEVENGIDDNCNFAIDEGLVSIPGIENALWNVYPNPAFNYLILEYQGDGYPEATYSIYSQTGEVILRGESFGLTTKIELGKLEEGTWVLEWISKETVHRTIFVVIR